MRIVPAVLLAVALLAVAGDARPAPATIDPALRLDDAADPLAIPRVGAWQLRVLSPRVLELTLVQTADRDGVPAAWDFATRDGDPRPPPASSFAATVDGRRVDVAAVGFLRRVLYAPLARRDLRLESRLSFRLAAPVPEGGRVELTDLAGVALPRGRPVAAVAASDRPSPAVHVTQAGFAPDLPKRARVGRWLGSLGDMPVEATAFRVVEHASGREVASGRLERRPEQGLVDRDPPYQQVFVADFSSLSAPGTYRVVVPGIGSSAPFRVHEGVPAAFARAFALGAFHQRCGEALRMPFTRFEHGECHVRPAEVPSPANRSVRGRLSHWTGREDGKRAPRLDRVEAALFPALRPSPLDTRGGHHDAGDYGKYTWNSASMIHALLFAADAFPGVGDLDNLGIPESGDGVPDLVQEAIVEARFLARMQDTDGGFFTLQQPRDRTYENDVPPDRGDPQVVFPKSTIATAAAVAALAQAASSPRVLRASPGEAAAWLAQARAGWSFLERAWEARGREGACQPVHHYGGEFDDRDEIAWAATELYLATGEPRFHRLVLDEFDPADRRTRKWTWIRLADAYGHAIRSYAFADRTGRAPAAGLDADHLRKCRAEVAALGDEIVSRAAASAYGTPLPFEAKRHRTVGWHFSSEAVFDLAAAHVLEPRPALIDAMAGALDWQAGGNPLDTSFVPGLGLRWPRDPVSGWALNSPRALPPTGVPVGDVVVELAHLPPYGNDLRRLRSPAANDPVTPFPVYERWGDSWNVQAEVTIPVLARSLGGAAFLMARTPVAAREWRGATCRIAGVPPGRVGVGTPVLARVECPGTDLREADAIWEVSGREPSSGLALAFMPFHAGDAFVEVEVRWPDGRRAFGRAFFAVLR
ncbi:MAG: glycoside hydrolase family 9 protein [Deltaproteobacteria bacterium]|nr:glycoside hydrolase family 9 protein [Deltaproteobacteria bacterium]